jgi:cytoskeletal protein CcmA (bactofilin family)
MVAAAPTTSPSTPAPEHKPMPVPAATPPTSAPAAPAPAAPPLSGSLRQTGTSRVLNVRTLEWTAKGFTKVVGDVEVGTGLVSGSLTVGGRLVARQLDLSGMNRVDGELRIFEDLRARGTLRTGATVSARNADLGGTVEIGGSLAVDKQLRWRGSLEVGHDVRAETVLFQGRLAVQGKLVAKSISGEVDTLSSVAEIEADWIEIRTRKPRFQLFLLPPPPWHELEVQRIEATEAHLSGVRVHRLKADRVFLGPDAHVEYVEGTIIQRHTDAHVGPESESPPPPGLSR